MRKCVFTLLTILTGGAAYALPVGNPAEASLLCNGLFWEKYRCTPSYSWYDAFSFRIGFYGDYVFNKHLERDNGVAGAIEKTELSTNAAYLAVNFKNRFDLFGTLGTTRLFLETGSITTSGRLEFETESDLSWSIGIRGTLWKCGCTYLGAEAQYFYTKPHITRLTEDATASSYPARNVNLKYEEWQIGLGLAHRIYNLVPYIAVRWGPTRTDSADTMLLLTNGNTTTLPSTKSKNNWGYAVGGTLIGFEKAALTLEGRFGGETALYTNGQIRF
ncbi:MAG: hypothetical protein JJU12_08165 [Chlamydiales bacterium]|nr:hypothetical protein [Chlamydiales bacterium]